MTFEEFRDDKKTFHAVVRCFEIIGEASAHIPPDIQVRYAAVPWRMLKDFRNVLAHVYFGVDTQILWKAAVEDLPKLSEQINLIKA